MFKTLSEIVYPLHIGAEGIAEPDEHGLFKEVETILYVGIVVIKHNACLPGHLKGEA